MQQNICLWDQINQANSSDLKEDTGYQSKSTQITTFKNHTTFNFVF
jgi:hypothetical protein